MFDNHRLAEIVSEDGLKHTAGHKRAPAFFFNKKRSDRAIPLQAQIDTFMGIIQPVMIFTPFFRRIEQHSWTKNPAFKLGLGQTVFYDKQFSTDNTLTFNAHEIRVMIKS
jgi:hypothetical protein